MKKPSLLLTALILPAGLLIFQACKKKENPTETDPFKAVKAAFGNKLNTDQPYNYAAQARPAYIMKDNGGANPINDKVATLGRVLFYDKKLSVNDNISCGSCHQQTAAFSDKAIRSTGVNGLAGRHSMRLINARFSQEMRFFWDERAANLEDQTTRPIQDHIEMGFSGQNGDPDINDLTAKLASVDYYKELFTWAFGDANVTETRLQTALSQFIRSIQSFDSRFDQGLAAAPNLGADFSNFTPQENMGKRIYLAPPAGPNPGAGCQGCHRAPEFDIDPASRNNGVTSVAGDNTASDFTVTRAPTLRDMLNPTGSTNGPFMHDGSLASLADVINHYNRITVAPGNNNIDPRLTPGGNPQNLGLTQQQKDALVAFLGTLTGKDVYTNPKWSDPFAP